jgi:aryl-alcohol dehydrogenase-like predicted oxidoreductase
MGKTDCRISDLVLGTYKFGGTDWGPVNDFDSMDTLRYCVDHGVNLIDTATGYGMGRAERLIRWALEKEPESIRNNVNIMTKWYLWRGRDEEKTRSISPGALKEFYTGSRKRLGRDRLDMVLLHRPDETTPLEYAVETLAELQSRGLIRYIGVSNFNLQQIKRAHSVAPLQIVQPKLNLIDKSFRDNGSLEYCRKEGIGVGVYSVLARGALAPRLKDWREFPPGDARREKHRGEMFQKIKRAHEQLQEVAERKAISVSQLAIAWVLSQSGVSFAIFGASTPEQARHNLRASGLRLSTDECRECESIIQGVRQS